MKKPCSLAFAALAGFLLLVCLLYLSVAQYTFDARNYPSSPPPFGEMAVELTDYLSGKAPALSDTFTQRERDHMTDVLALFQGAKRLATGCFAFSLLFLAASFCLGGGKCLADGLLIGFGLFLGVVLFIGAWALIDFSGWFTAMHEMVFTNDLWLLDPAESLLIRMLPLEFFVAAVTKVTSRFVLYAACMLLACIVARILFKRKKLT